MAQETIGALRVVLGLDSAAFEQGRKKAERSAKRMGRNMQRIGAKMTVAFTGAAVALTGMATQAVNTFSEIDNLAKVAGVGVERFKVLSLASKQFGIEQEKLSDILKDVNDKFGDYFQTGAGPLADFFENIAPRVGLTAEAFKGLSSEQALGKYVKALEDANVNQQEMTFYMEAIASDATALLPIFKNNSAAIEETARKAKELGLSFDRDMIEKAKSAKAEFALVSDILKTNLQAALVDLIPAIAEMGKAFIPVLQSIARWVSRLAERFKALSPEQQKMITMFVAVAAAAGPVLVVVGSLVTAIAAMLGPIGLVVVAILGAGGLVAAFMRSASAAREATSATQELQGLIGKGQQQRKQQISDTTELADEQLRVALNTREVIKAKIEEAKIDLENARRSAQRKRRKSFSNFSGGMEGFKEDQAALKLEAEIIKAEAEMIAQQKRIDEIRKKLKGKTSSAPSKASERNKGVGSIKKVGGSKSVAAEAREHIKNQKALAAAYAISKQEGDLVAEMQRLLAAGFKGTTEELRKLAEESLKANKSLDDSRKKLSDQAEANRLMVEQIKERALAHANVTEAAEKEIQTNARLTEALMVSEKEYRIVAEMLRLLESGFVGSEEAARSMAERLVESRDQLRIVGDQAKETGDKIEGAFKKGVSGLKGFISAIQNGDIASAIDSLVGLIGGVGTSSGSSGGLLGGIKSIFGGFRADGGPVTAGKSYIVGERGPEWFTPGRSGGITPNGGAGSVVQIVPSLYFDQIVDGRAANVANQIAPVHANSAVGRASNSASRRQAKRLA